MSEDIYLQQLKMAAKTLSDASFALSWAIHNLDKDAAEPAKKRALEIEKEAHILSITIRNLIDEPDDEISNNDIDFLEAVNRIRLGIIITQEEKIKKLQARLKELEDET